MPLEAQIVDVADLTRQDQGDMFRLMEAHYEDVDPSFFEKDLAEKQWVIQVHDPDSGQLCGFSTQTVLDVQAGERTVKALFSGDTIVDRAHWGDPALTSAGGLLSIALIDRFPGEELYWFLISQGYKTYRFLPVFFHEFYPRYDRPTPGDVQCVIDALALAKYPHEYRAEEGVIHPCGQSYRLRDGVATITQQRLRDPHIRYFVERNPGHAVGHELCCVAPLTRGNFTEAAHRVMAAGSGGSPKMLATVTSMG